MPPEAVTPGSPADWIRYAVSDLAIAEAPVPSGVLLETLCYHTQQSVEKAIKAVLLHNGVRFPYTHDIARLITVLRDAGIPWEPGLDEAAGLTDYAVESRYPGWANPPSEANRQQAVDIARKVLEWAKTMVQSS